MLLFHLYSVPSSSFLFQKSPLWRIGINTRASSAKRKSRQQTASSPQKQVPGTRYPSDYEKNIFQFWDDFCHSVFCGLLSLFSIFLSGYRLPSILLAHLMPPLAPPHIEFQEQYKHSLWPPPPPRPLALTKKLNLKSLKNSEAEILRAIFFSLVMRWSWRCFFYLPLRLVRFRQTYHAARTQELKKSQWATLMILVLSIPIAACYLPLPSTSRLTLKKSVRGPCRPRTILLTYSSGYVRAAGPLWRKY